MKKTELRKFKNRLKICKETISNLDSVTDSELISSLQNEIENVKAEFQCSLDKANYKDSIEYIYSNNEMQREDSDNRLKKLKTYLKNNYRHIYNSVIKNPFELTELLLETDSIIVESILTGKEFSFQVCLFQSMISLGYKWEFVKKSYYNKSKKRITYFDFIEYESKMKEINKEDTELSETGKDIKLCEMLCKDIINEYKSKKGFQGIEKIRYLKSLNPEINLQDVQKKMNIYLTIQRQQTVN